MAAKKSRWRWPRRILILLLLASLGYNAWIAAHIWWWVNHNPSTSAFMETRLETMQEKNPKAALQHQWLAYGNISDNLKRALIAAEDARFVDHE